jgi:hypothetical protein
MIHLPARAVDLSRAIARLCPRLDRRLTRVFDRLPPTHFRSRLPIAEHRGPNQPPILAFPGTVTSESGNVKNPDLSAHCASLGLFN